MKIVRIFLFILAVAVMLSTSRTAFAQDTADLYKTKCVSCHGADGKGGSPIAQKLGVRDFHSAEVTKESDQELFDITKKGKNKMPAYDGKLTDDQINALVKYIRGLK